MEYGIAPPAPPPEGAEATIAAQAIVDLAEANVSPAAADAWAAEVAFLRATPDPLPAPPVPGDDPVEAAIALA